MIEIGPNLKEALLDYMYKNLQLGKPPGHLLSNNFGELLKDEITKIYGNTAQACSDAREYPTKSGYYWFKNNWGHKVIVRYCEEFNYFSFSGDKEQYPLKFMKLMHGHFIEPIEPIPEP